MQNTYFIEDEDGGDAFQVKKSSFSRKIHKERNKKHKSKSSSNDSQNSNLNSLRESNNSSSPPPSTKLTTAKESNYVKEIHSDDGFSVRLLLSIL